MSLLNLPRMWAQAVVDAVKRNEEWRGERCINLLAPEAPNSPMVRDLLLSEIGTRAAEGNIGRVIAGLPGPSTSMRSSVMCRVAQSRIPL